jgi:hypothetical protein
MREAENIIQQIKGGKSTVTVRSANNYNATDWFNYSAKAYALNLAAEQLKRSADEQRPHVSTTSSNEMLRILQLNEPLAAYALLLPVTATISNFEQAEKLAAELPTSEALLIGSLPNSRWLRSLEPAKKGRFEEFPFFNIFSKLIDVIFRHLLMQILTL